MAVFQGENVRIGEQRAKGWPAKVGGKNRNIFSKEEMRFHRMLIERLLRDLGMPATRTIQNVLAKGNDKLDPPIPPTRLSRPYIDKVIARIVEQWTAESEKHKGLGKEAQIRRIMALRNKADAKGDIKAAVTCEKEIAMLQGNYAPIRVEAEVVHREALMVALGSLNDAQLVAQMERAAQLAAAEQRLRLLEARGDVVDAEPEPANTVGRRA